jgi:hypothetical protein
MIEGGRAVTDFNFTSAGDRGISSCREESFSQVWLFPLSRRFRVKFLFSFPERAMVRVERMMESFSDERIGILPRIGTHRTVVAESAEQFRQGSFFFLGHDSVPPVQMDSNLK